MYVKSFFCFDCLLCYLCFVLRKNVNFAVVLKEHVKQIRSLVM